MIKNAIFMRKIATGARYSNSWADPFTDSVYAYMRA